MQKLTYLWVVLLSKFRRPNAKQHTLLGRNLTKTIGVST